MRHLVHRFGARASGRWGVLALLLIGLAIAGLVLVPRVWRGTPYLELVALSPQGTFTDAIVIPAGWAGSGLTEWGPVTRFPLLLGVRNVGSAAARPVQLRMSVPARYRLSTSDGRVLHVLYAAGSPLVSYTVSRELPQLAPGMQPVLVGADTVWIEPLLPSIYCLAGADSVPEFVAAPEPDLDALSRVLIFYSLDGGEQESRHTGLLDIQLDRAAMRFEPAQPISVFQTAVFQPEIPGPVLSALRYVGYRRAFCGEPEDPVELFTTTWESVGGARMLVLSLGGRDRKYLYDLSGDGFVDVERWDANGDGYFESMRRARFEIPAFLLPILREIPTFDWEIFAQLPPDSALRLDPYRAGGVYQPRTQPQDTLPYAERFGRERVPLPEEEAQQRAAPARPAGPRVLGSPVD
jgi:hypothetical protein